jgi:hypothetical protein
VTKVAPDIITIHMDGKDERTVSFNPSTMRQHFDHGYAVTSHSSQGLTAARVLANIDTETSRLLIKPRLAYVAISRPPRTRGSTPMTPPLWASGYQQMFPRAPRLTLDLLPKLRSRWNGFTRGPSMSGTMLRSTSSQPC